MGVNAVRIKKQSIRILNKGFCIEDFWDKNRKTKWYIILAETQKNGSMEADSTNYFLK